MRLRRSLNRILLLAIVALAALVWFVARGPGGPAALTDVAIGEVDRLQIASPRAERTPLALIRRNDGWHVTSPIERPARDGRIVTALRVLDAGTDTCYPVAEHDMAEFGLQSPRLHLQVNDTGLDFGDRAADGRRYVRAGDRFCLLPDRYYPLLQQGLDGLARPGLLHAQETPRRIATPAAAATRGDTGTGWRFNRGHGDGEAWANHWRSAQADGFVLDPPRADLGRVRLAVGEHIREWRIAARKPELILVPRNADYGLRIAADQAQMLLTPPAGGS